MTIAGAAGAATPKPSRTQASTKSPATGQTYRCVDKDGVVHFGDSVPPEAVNSERKVLNDYGVAVSTEAGAKSAEQVAAEQAAAEQAEAERQKAIIVARRDQVLLDTYLSVEEIEALRHRRLELIETQITVTENYLVGLREILVKLQEEAASFKPYSSDPKAAPIDQRLAKELSTTMDSILLYEKNLKDSRLRKTEVAGSFAADISRFKELKAAAAAE